jgi:hypothetical protein
LGDETKSAKGRRRVVFEVEENLRTTLADGYTAHVYGCEVGQLGDHPVDKIKYIEVALRIERHTAAAAEAFIGQDVRRGWRSRWDNDHLLAGVKTSTRSQLRQDEKIAGRIKRETGRLSDEKRSRGHRLGGSASVGGYVYAAVAS